MKQAQNYILLLCVALLSSCYDKSLIETGRTLGKKNVSIETSLAIFSDENNPNKGQAGQGPAPGTFMGKFKYGVGEYTDLFLEIGMIENELGIKRNLLKSNDKKFSLSVSTAVGSVFTNFGNGPFVYSSNGLYGSFHFEDGIFLTTGAKPVFGVYDSEPAGHICFGGGIGKEYISFGGNSIGSIHAEITGAEVLYNTRGQGSYYFDPMLYEYNIYSLQFTITARVIILKNQIKSKSQKRAIEYYPPVR